MINHSEKEIVERCMSIFENEDSVINHLTVEVLQNDKDKIRISIYQMYDGINLSMDKLELLSEFFDSKKIGDEEFDTQGCESCDYGSQHGFILEVLP